MNYVDEIENFYETCRRGEVDMVKLICYYEPHFKKIINVNYDKVFRIACRNGHLLLAQWIYANFDVDIHAKNEYSLRKSCKYNHLHILEWLYATSIKINSPLNIRVDNESPFKSACRNGALLIVQWIADYNNDKIRNKKIYAQRIQYAFCIGCTNNQLDIAEWGVKRNINIDLNFRDYLNIILKLCCKNGNLSIIKWLRLQFCDLQFDISQLCMSIYSGSIELVKYIYASDPSFADIIHDGNDIIFRTACYHGFIDIAKWIFYDIKHVNRFSKIIVSLNEDSTYDMVFKDDTEFSWIYYTSNLEIYKWIYEEVGGIYRFLFNHKVFIESCSNGHLDIAQWINTIRYNEISMFYNEAFAQACFTNQLHILQWLYDEAIAKKCPIDISYKENIIITNLCSGGQIDILRWLCDKQQMDITPYISLAFHNACLFGKFITAKLIYQEFTSNIVFDKETPSTYCNTNINLDMMEWLFDILQFKMKHDFMFMAFQEACRYGRLNVAKWLHEHPRYKPNCHNNDYIDIFKQACATNLDMVKWIYLLCDGNYLNETINDAFTIACLCNKIDIAKWLYQLSSRSINLCWSDYYVFVHCCEYNYIDLAKWIYELCGNIDPSPRIDKSFLNVCHNNYVPMAKWMSEMFDGYTYELNKEFQIITYSITPLYNRIKGLSDDKICELFKFNYQKLL